MSGHYHFKSLLRYLSGFFFLLSVGSACGAFNKGDDNICIKVGSRNITIEDLKNDIEFIGADMEISTEEKKLLKNQLVEQCINHYLILAYADEEKIFIEEQELEHALKELKKEYTEKEFEEALLKGYVDQDMWNQRYKEQLLVNKVIRKITENMPQPTYEEIKQFYENNQDLFWSPKVLKFRQIVTQNRAEAENMLVRLNQGENMSDLAKKHSIAPEGQMGGEVGWVSEEQLNESMSNVLFSLTKGKLSSVTETSYGYHIFKVLEIRPAGNVPLANVIDEIKTTLVSRKRDSYVRCRLDKLRNHFEVIVNNETLNTLEF